MDKFRSELIGLLLVGLTLIVFLPVRDHDFVWDDGGNIVENPHFQPPTVTNALRVWERPYWGLYVPLTYTVWAGLARIAQIPAKRGNEIEFKPRPFHLANVGFHILGALVVFAILKMLVRHDWAAFGGALLFAWHPVQVEAVAWATGLKDVLSGFLSLVALWLYLKHKRLPYVFATLAFVLAVLAKPGAIAVPVVAWVLDYFVLRRSMRQCILTVSPWVVLACPFIVVNKLAQPDTEIPFITPLWTRPLVAADALAFYLYKLAFPVWLGPDYGRSPEWLLQQGWVYLTWIVPFGVGIFVWLRRSPDPWLVASALVSVAGMLPVSGLVPFAFQRVSTVADRYLYLSMLGPALALAWFVAEHRRRLGTALCAVIVALLAVLSSFQSHYWRDNMTLFQHALWINPNSWLGHNNLGSALFKLGKLEEATQHYRQALSIDPARAETHYNLGDVLAEQGNLDEAIDRYRQAVTIDPARAMAHNNLAIALVRVGDLGGAVEHFHKALSIDPDHAKAHYNLGIALARQGNLEEATNHFRQALRIQPEFAEAHEGLARLLIRQGKRDEAVKHMEEALRLLKSRAKASNS